LGCVWTKVGGDALGENFCLSMLPEKMLEVHLFAG
jgi:hypothetical protein